MSKLIPQIYVACLASYNAGMMHGAWIDANQDPDRIRQAISDMLANSPTKGAEEWAIHDYDDFCDVHLSEYESVETLAEIAEFLVEYGELGALVFDELGDLSSAQSAMEDQYYGEYDSEIDYVQSYAEECFDIPEHLRYYIDYQKLARDIFATDCFSVNYQGKVHVFHY